MAIAMSHNVMGRFLDALGLTGQNVRRVVVVMDVNDAVRCYVERLMHEEEVDAMADHVVEGQTIAVTEVGGVEVDERGRAYVPAAEYASLQRRNERMREALEEIASGRWTEEGAALAAGRALPADGG